MVEHKAVERPGGRIWPQLKDTATEVSAPAAGGSTASGDVFCLEEISQIFIALFGGF
jgi:hypothetical protein